jgi:hypothetical protein
VAGGGPQKRRERDFYERLFEIISHEQTRKIQFVIWLKSFSVSGFVDVAEDSSHFFVSFCVCSRLILYF